MAESNRIISKKLQKRIDNLTALRDKLVERNWWLTEPQYSWLAKNNSDLVKWIRKIVKNSWLGEIKERRWDTQLSNPDLPWLTWWNWLNSQEWSFLALAWALWRPLNPTWSATTLTAAFANTPEVALLPEAFWTLRAWARNGKNYLYDLQKKYWSAGKDYDQYIKTLEDIDRNLSDLDITKSYVEHIENAKAERWKPDFNALDALTNQVTLDYINNQIKDSAIDDRFDNGVVQMQAAEPIKYLGK